ncbi:dTDP-4-dehydrorhamnose 3,5-epimerase family protein [Alphaproteobacteria bacterium]|nr:dTDP-4-dehydrorhamnose 3,5-epimerase family protein [Alphaproteobacteria bacterium]
MGRAKTDIQGISLIETESFNDERGTFSRLFCSSVLVEILEGRTIKQINTSHTKAKGSIRGLHFQAPPKPEMKLIRCLRGAIWDVAVDLRAGSPTFLRSFGVRLSAENLTMVVIPEGFAHGFQTLEPDSELLYLHTEFYSSSLEGGVRFDDPVLDIQWPIKPREVSERDKTHDLIEPGFRGITL